MPAPAPNGLTLRSVSLIGALAAGMVAQTEAFAESRSENSTVGLTAKPVKIEAKPEKPEVTAKSCKPSRSKLGVARTITLDAKGGPQFGFVNYPGKQLLRDKEVLLTFDDGPLPRYTHKILEAMERECTRATFFLVGRMAIAFPKSVRRILREGHTVGTHTWSHGNLQRGGPARAVDQIERGIAAIEAAAEQKISPLFRFPYLGRTSVMETHLKSRDIAAFSIDVDSRDTRGYSPSRMISHTIARLKKRGKGIVLFHDIKRSTAAAVPGFLRALRKNGFKIVHLETSSYSPPRKKLKKRYDDLLAARASGDKKRIKVARRALRYLPERNQRIKRTRPKAKIKLNSSSLKPGQAIPNNANPFNRAN
ncbi:MAG: polysaccharide deacetylase family protein [Pseudomonadota bacterium]